MNESAPVVTQREPRARRTAVSGLIDGRIQQLLRTMDRGSTRATLASLRSAVGREVGSVPEIWGVTLDGVPGRPAGDEPTAEEVAVHTALTLFALHQQSKTQPVHVRGIGFGQAVRRLEAASAGAGTAEVSPVRRRFDALATSVSAAESVHHLRGLITQMRAPSIGLDYGLLGEDLVDLQHPDRAGRVRLRWARQYYRTDRDDSDEGHSASAPDAAGAAVQEEEE